MGTSIQFVSRLLSPTGLFVGGLIAVLAWGGALDGVIAKWRQFVGDFAIGGRTIGQWMQVIGKVWTLLTPIWNAGMNVMLGGLRIFIQAVKISAMRLLQEISIMMIRMSHKIVNSMNSLIDAGNLSFLGKRMAEDLRLLAINMRHMATDAAETWDKILVPERQVMDKMRDRLVKAFGTLKTIAGKSAEEIQVLFADIVGNLFEDIVGSEGIQALADLKRRLGDIMASAGKPRDTADGLGGAGDDIATAGTFSARAVGGMAGMGVFNQQLNAQNEMVNLLSSIDGKTPSGAIAQ